MVSPAITTTLATEEDAQTLASIMTSAFSASDAAYPLIWAGPTAPDGIHDIVAVKGLFSPVQKEDRLTFKAVDGERVVGFATWNMPKGNAAVRRKVEKGGLPNIPGVNVSLWSEKVEGLKDVADRDVEPGKDMCLLHFQTSSLRIN
ncbi:uncharacterized protein LY89DRAFT_688241 [Mollisia scopiformis]|uniref:N-acetyltransferase domain-containing protein n=1 Tax=Mollisia scopiformis TaxID=149040 RepID=A0A194WX80_MOLSC|nr:uncharacterized protein LY89DRAFT_688241 [Mollisia scopiformis]KUJ12588.1 hypothetical protein LY89DRAFT_688241 [Mollisia scopiformis]